MEHMAGLGLAIASKNFLMSPDDIKSAHSLFTADADLSTFMTNAMVTAAALSQPEVESLILKADLAAMNWLSPAAVLLQTPEASVSLQAVYPS